MPKSKHQEPDTTFGYPIEEVKSSSLDPLSEITEGVMDNIEEDMHGSTGGSDDERDSSPDP